MKTSQKGLDLKIFKLSYVHMLVRIEVTDVNSNRTTQYMSYLISSSFLCGTLNLSKHHFMSDQSLVRYTAIQSRS